ncbi:MAG TPA: hypothetical protein VMX11_04530 [Actinomycetes bacterium]|nr:hypothetical protein [Actinomycetes bacterium]
MSQTVEYVVKVNGAQQGAAQVAIVEKSLVQADVAAKRAGASIDRAVAPTRNLGQAGLEASRAIEDLQYGFNGIVNNIPSLVMGLGASAGVAGALSLVAVGANQVIKYLNKEMPDAAAEGAKTIKIEIEGLNKDLQDMALELRSLASGDSIRRLRAEAIAASSADEARIAGEAFRERFGDLSQRDIANQRAMYDASKTARDIVDAYDQAYAVGEKAAKAQAAFVRTIQIEQMRQLKDQEAVDEKNAKKGRAGRARDFDVDGELELRAKANAWLAKMREEAMDLRRKERQAEARELANDFRDMDKDRRDRERAEAREQKRANDLRVREHKRALAEMAKAEQRFSDYAVGLASATTDQLAGSFTDYLMAKVEGQEHAEAQAIASFLSATGQQLVASGVRGIFEGAIISANPLTPGAGVGMIATGGAAIVAGMAMAGGGAAISGAIPTSTGSGASQAARDPGASPRGSGASSGGGGPMIINVAYGAGGPLPEDIAREIGRVVRSGDRRRGAS